MSHYEGQNVVIKITLPHTFYYQGRETNANAVMKDIWNRVQPYFFYYNGKLLTETESEYIIQDIKLGEKAIPKKDIVEIRPMNQWDIMKNVEKSEKFLMSNTVRRLDSKLTAKWENLKKEFEELKKELNK